MNTRNIPPLDRSSTAPPACTAGPATQCMAQCTDCMPCNSLLTKHGACLCAALLATLTACANRPESISASYVSFEKYMDSDCTGLATRMSDARATLAKHSEMQNDKANGDAVGVFLLGIPFSKLSGDHEADVAKWKGEIEAIETAQIKKRCL